MGAFVMETEVKMKDNEWDQDRRDPGGLEPFGGERSVSQPVLARRPYSAPQVIGLEYMEISAETSETDDENIGQGSSSLTRF